MPSHYLVLECAAANCTAEFYLNDAPIIRRGMEIGRFFGGPMDDWMIEGENELSIVIEPDAIPSEALCPQDGRLRLETAGMEARARVVRYPHGATVGSEDGEILCELLWTPPPYAPTLPFPQTTGVTFELAPEIAHGRWAWQDAKPVAITTETEAGIRQFLNDLRASLASGSAEDFLIKSRTRLEETERAYGLEPGERAQLIRQTTTEESAQAWWGLEELDSVAWSLRPIARGRMIEVMAEDWHPIVREHLDADEGRSYYDMMISQVNGNWQILR